LKRGRFEASPGAALSLRDAFFTKVVFNLALTYHVTENVGVSLHGGYSAHLISSAAQICTTGAAGTGASRTCRSPDWVELDGRAPGKISLLGGLDLQWAPIYGKIALMAQTFAHFDMYGLVGPTFVQYVGPSNVANSTVGGNVGIGMRFIMNRFIAIRTELRDLVYVENVAGRDPSLRNQFFFELGVSFFLPTNFEEG
jgi:outer membrane beta-barrel protein